MKDLKKIIMVMSFVGSVAMVHAAGTAAGTSIANTATVDFTVNSASQPQQNSNTYTFLVDRRIAFTVTRDNGAIIPAGPNTTNVLAVYTVTNTGNATQDFDLSVVDGASPFAADTHNALDYDVFADSRVGSNGTYESGTDTTDYVDQLVADGTRKVFVLTDFGALADGNVVGLELTATAAVGAVNDAQGANEVNDENDADVVGAVDVVFADAAGNSDAANDGLFTVLNAYQISSTTLVITKTSTIIDDPVNGGLEGDDKRIPGAEIEYSISVQNTGGQTATNVTINDVLDANMTYVAASLVVDAVSEDDDAVGANETDPNGASYDGVNSVQAVIGSIAAAATKVFTFRATID